MKKSVLLMIVLFVCLSCEKVYVCRGSYSEVYHDNRYCRGLKNCSKRVDMVSIPEAKRMGRRPCQICAKR